MNHTGHIVDQITTGWWIATIGAPPASRAWAIILGVVFAIIALSLLIASWTRWGQTKPLAKCVGIAVLAHIWLLMYAYGTRIVSPGFGPGSDGGVQQSSDPPATFAWEGMATSPATTTSSADATSVADATSADESSTPSLDRNQHSANDRTVDAITPAAQPWELASSRLVSEQVDAPKLPKESVHLAEPSPDETSSIEGLMDLTEMLAESELLSLADLPIDPTLPPASVVPATPAATPPPPAARSAASLANVPVMYRMRMSPERSQYAASLGGDANTETAVQNALAWLARSQSPDGSWNAQQFGAGSIDRGAASETEGRYRSNAGQRADTAMTGLALLAFLGAGHTHREGYYAETVKKGLQYLRSQQFPSGDLSGRNQIGQEPTVRYARMYSHGMAGLAIAEAYAMTGDASLLPALQAAAAYSLQAMNSRTGGWRYDFASDDPGDTSQFGWQAMLLNSASKSRAIAIPGPNRLGLQRFLDSVSTGRHGGLAVYRNITQGAPAPISAATPAMTAEAMAMRCMLDLPISASAAREAQEMILANLPGRSQENLYYWYYAALTMFQLRSQTNLAYGTRAGAATDAAWERWNDAMKRQLCGSQVVQGPDAGSWNPTCVWGSYGGRIYSTATACMCLEVYYRYLPLYQEIANDSGTAAMSK
ncbi:MAG: hypothetical protein KGQ51_05005 [Planctomycetes bacterium]|nr:hypothetical protein [Planctomycetota bacterium]